MMSCPFSIYRQPGMSKSEHVDSPSVLSLHETSTSPSRLSTNLTTLHASSPISGNTSLDAPHTDTKPWSALKPSVDSKNLYLGAKPVPFGSKSANTSTGVASTGSSPLGAPPKHDTNTTPKVIAPTGFTPTQTTVVKESEKHEQTPRIRGYHLDPSHQSRSFRLLKTLVDSEEGIFISKFVLFKETFPKVYKLLQVVAHSWCQIMHIHHARSFYIGNIFWL